MKLLSPPPLDAQVSLAPCSFVGLFVRDILSLVLNFDFYSWSFVKRGGNRVVHNLTYCQPFSLEGKVCESSILDDILNQASKDMYAYVAVSYTHLTLPTNREV